MELRRTLTSAFLVPALLIVMQNNLSAQSHLTTMPFLKNNIEARSTGMASSNIAMRNNRAGVHLNPATIGNPGRLKISTQFTDINPFSAWHLGTQWSTGGYRKDAYFYMPSIQYSKNEWSLAYQYTHLDLLKREDNPPWVEERASAYEYAHTVTTAYQWNKYLAAGAGINYINSNRGHLADKDNAEIDPVRSLTLDVGLHGAYPSTIIERLTVTPSVGWSLTDFGTPVNYGTERQYPLPITMRGGLGFRLEYLNSSHQGSFFGEKYISAGVYRSFSKILARFEQGYNPQEPHKDPMGPFKALFKSWSSYESFNGEEMITIPPRKQIMHHSGWEITLLDIVSFRQGYSKRGSTNRKWEHYSSGFGLYFNYVSFSYVQRLLSDISYFQFTISIPEKWLSRL